MGDDKPLAKDIMQALYFVTETGIDIPNRTIYLAEEIEEVGGVSSALLMAFKAFEKTPEPITIYIDTPGGSMAQMFAIYDIITSSPNEVIGIGVGEIASAGVLLLACCDKRYVTENAVLMSHQPTVEGQTLRLDEAKARRRWEDWNQERWAELMARHTPKDKTYWNRITKKEAELWLLGGEEIVAAGLADEVIKPVV